MNVRIDGKCKNLDQKSKGVMIKKIKPYELKSCIKKSKLIKISLKTIGFLHLVC